MFRLSDRFRIDAAGRRLPDVAVPSIDDAARHYRAREFATAATVCDAILSAKPRDFDALHLRGVLCLELKQPEQALAFLARAARERADDPQLLFHTGNALSALRRYAEAEAAFRRSLALRPGHFDTLNNLGSALNAALRHADALEWFREALAVRPGAVQALYNIGRALLALERPEEAIESLRAALAAARTDADRQRLIDLHSSPGEALVRLGRYDEALAVLRAAPQAIADAPEIVWNESLTLLMLGDYAEGWRKYECRFLVPDHDPPRDGASVLDPDTVAGRRVLVFPEQGRGDMIQFARYLPLLAERGATVLVEMYADLAPLFRTIEGVMQVVTPDDPAPEHDLLTPLLSLPRAFETTLDSIPARVPYLRVPPCRAAQWAALLGPRTCPRIGVAWRGSQASARRSALPAEVLAPLLAAPGVAFHALQKEVSEPEQKWLRARTAVVLHGEALDDFADTAALISELDLVISIDTAVAHLAGALGKPVWIMLPFSPDWRWLRDREDSPWYPTARLFRQARRGEWADVVRRAGDALAACVFE